MKKQYAVILLTLTAFLGLVVVAESQGQHEVTVTVPFDFVAAGNALPAGRYKVSRVAEDGISGLIMRNDETGSSVIVLPNQLESNATDDLKVSFKQIGDARFLNKIGTQNGVYTIPLSQPLAVIGGVNRHQGASAAGTP